MQSGRKTGKVGKEEMRNWERERERMRWEREREREREAEYEHGQKEKGYALKSNLGFE